MTKKLALEVIDDNLFAAENVIREYDSLYSVNNNIENAWLFAMKIVEEFKNSEEDIDYKFIENCSVKMTTFWDMYEEGYTGYSIEEINGCYNAAVNILTDGKEYNQKDIEIIEDMELFCDAMSKDIDKLINYYYSAEENDVIMSRIYRRAMSLEKLLEEFYSDK